RRRHTRFSRDWSSDVCSSDLKYFGDWGELMNDTVIATAILDRLLHHAHIINIRGESYRLKDRLKGGVRVVPPADVPVMDNLVREIGRASCRERGSRAAGAGTT